MRYWPCAVLFPAAVILLAAGSAGRWASAAEPAEARFYVVDVGHGNAVFAVAPAGEVLLMDTGAPLRHRSRVGLHVAARHRENRLSPRQPLS